MWVGLCRGAWRGAVWVGLSLSGRRVGTGGCVRRRVRVGCVSGGGWVSKQERQNHPLLPTHTPPPTPTFNHPPPPPRTDYHTPLHPLSTPSHIHTYNSCDRFLSGGMILGSLLSHPDLFLYTITLPAVLAVTHPLPFFILLLNWRQEYSYRLRNRPLVKLSCPVAPEVHPLPIVSPFFFTPEVLRNRVALRHW
jgi:hypothetical protein